MSVNSVMNIGLGKLWKDWSSQLVENWDWRDKSVDNKKKSVFPVEVRDCDVLIMAVSV